ncbi:hypothetical protein [Bradyrhizobium sp. PRIMUS42]|uniref:hypothetical protein n=2 Tax=unclassified Bradyrhizobium TaxID=2631580 RepID=UPI001FF2FD0F|nr:hypothetical protein [Bradyrhizobium sp. PRIMUS42]
MLLENAKMTTIHMDSSVSQTITRAVMNGGVLNCTKASDKDVYSHSIWATESNIRQFTMHEGDSIVVPPGSTLTVWIFRKQPGQSTWKMEFELKEKAA